MQKIFTFEVKWLFQLRNELQKLVDEGYHIDSVQTVYRSAFGESGYDALVIISKE